MLKKILLASTVLAIAAAPVLAQPVTLRIVSKDLLTTNPQDVAHIERIEQALAAQGTEVDLQIVDLPSSGYADALSVMMLGGDIPDIIYFQGGDAMMAEQGVLEDLTPYIENSQHIKAGLWPHNVERLKNYPYLLYVYPPRNPQAVVRQNWLEESGVADPQTVEDYTALFQAIKDQHGAYGITAAESTAELDSIFNQAFGVSATWLKDENGEWVNSRVSTQQRDKIAYYAQLRADGLLDPEYVTTKWDIKEDKFYTGRVGVILGSSPEVIDIYGGKLRQVEPDATITLLDPPEGPGGKGIQAVDVSKESRGFAISSLSEHKEEAFAVLDFMASPEGQMMDRMGFEGEHYNADGETYTVTDQMATWYARFMVTSNWTPPVTWQSDAAVKSLENTAEYFVADNSFVWPAEYAADTDAANTVYNSWMARFISGEVPMDQWDAYVAEWNAAGGQRLTDYAKTVLAE